MLSRAGASVGTASYTATDDFYTNADIVETLSISVSRLAEGVDGVGRVETGVAVVLAGAEVLVET